MDGWAAYLAWWAAWGMGFSGAVVDVGLVLCRQELRCFELLGASKDGIMDGPT
jgi:hypothetical protein